MKDTCISQAGEPAAALLPVTDKASQRILVVDDDQVIRKFNARVLSHFGFQVDTAEDGHLAWEALQLKKYDLLVTDNDMPKVTGVELLKKVYSARMILLVIMATGVPPDEFTHAPWLHPDAILTKPYSIEKLVGTVSEVLRIRASEESGEVALPATERPAPTNDNWRL
jgi:DNA-binding response OmpR family regulator